MSLLEFSDYEEATTIYAMEMPSIQALSEITQKQGWDAVSYPVSYPQFIKYFQTCRQPLSVHDVVIGICFTYSWMPTMLEIYENSEEGQTLENCANILTKAKEGMRISLEEFKMLVKTFNNSEVGPSKLLHFIAPELYPIWDSRVKRALKQSGKFDYPLFREKCLEITNESGFNELHEKILKNSKYSIPDFKHSKLRSLDMLLYVLGKP